MVSGICEVEPFTKFKMSPTPDMGFDVVGGIDVLGRVL